MNFPDEHPMERNFILRLRKMVSQKSDAFQDEFFRRTHVINHYMLMSGGAFTDVGVAAGIALDMDLEDKWGRDVVNK